MCIHHDELWRFQFVSSLLTVDHTLRSEDEKWEPLYTEIPGFYTQREKYFFWIFIEWFL